MNEIAPARRLMLPRRRLRKNGILPTTAVPQGVPVGVYENKSSSSSSSRNNSNAGVTPGGSGVDDDGGSNGVGCTESSNYSGTPPSARKGPARRVRRIVRRVASDGVKDHADYAKTVSPVVLTDLDQQIVKPAPASDDLSEPSADRVAVPQTTLVTPDTGASVAAASAVSATSSRRKQEAKVVAEAPALTKRRASLRSKHQKVVGDQSSSRDGGGGIEAGADAAAAGTATASPPASPRMLANKARLRASSGVGGDGSSVVVAQAEVVMDRATGTAHAQTAGRGGGAGDGVVKADEGGPRAESAPPAKTQWTQAEQVARAGPRAAETAAAAAETGGESCTTPARNRRSGRLAAMAALTVRPERITLSLASADTRRKKHQLRRNTAIRLSREASGGDAAGDSNDL